MSLSSRIAKINLLPAWVFLLSILCLAPLNAEPIASISSPQPGQHVNGTVSIQGTANAVGVPMDLYSLAAEIGGGINVYVQFNLGFDPVNGGQLGVWNTLGHEEGPLNLRLIVFDANLTSATYIVPVFVDRSVPVISDFSATPSPAGPGAVQLEFTVSEPLSAVPSVTVAGAAASFVSLSGLTYRFSYMVTGATPQGTVPVVVNVVDTVNLAGSGNFSFVVDRIAPAQVTGLAVTATAPSPVDLNWTAPSDTGPTGRASAYQIRYALSPITEGNFASATAAPNPPVPQAPGASESYSLVGLLPNTRYYVALKSMDSVGNLSALSNVETWLVIVDTTPPVTQIAASAPSVSLSSGTSLSLASQISFSATDDMAGVQLTEYRLNGDSFKTYSAPFALPAGAIVVEYRSRDNANNLEAIKQATYFVDGTAPVSGLAAGAPNFDPGGGQPLYMGPSALLSLSAVDPVVNGVSAGVSHISSRMDGGASQAYGAPFPLPSEGAHNVQHFAVDRVNNAEAPQARSFRMDATPPTTQLSLSNGIQLPSGDYVGSAASLVTLSASDPVSNGVAAGLAATEVQVNGGGFNPYTSPLSLSEGGNTVEFRSQDNVQNMEADQVAVVSIDATAPSAFARAPVGGMIFKSGLDMINVMFSVEDEMDPNPSSQAYLIHQVLGTSVPVVNGGQVPAASLAPGTWRMRIIATDWVGNTRTVTTGIFSVMTDVLAPRTTVTAGSPQFGTSPIFITPVTPFTAAAVDDAVSVGDEAGFGVSQTFFSLDGAAAQPFPASLNVTGEGAHTLRVHSVDVLNHAETPQTLSLAVDMTPPVSTLTPGSPAVEVGGALYVSPLTPLTVNVQDPLSGGVASGVSLAERSIDGGAFEAVSGPFSLVEGFRNVAHRAADNVDNMSSPLSLSLRVDGTAPVTSLTVGAPSVLVGGQRIVTSATPLTLSGADPSSNGVTSGVKTTSARQDSASFQPVSGPLALSGADGLHTLNFFSTDQVNNAETAQSVSLGLDNTPPVSSATLTSSQVHSVAGTLYASGNALVVLSAHDPQTGGVAAGVDRIIFSLDGGAPQVYGAPILLSNGSHSLAYHAVDKLGHAETSRTLNIAVDETAPETTLTLGEPQHTAGGQTYITPATTLSLSAVDAGAGVASVRYRVNGGSFVTYAAPFVLAEGTRLVEFQAQDVVGNVEALQSRTFLVDAAAPQSTLSVGTPQVAGSPVIVGLQTPLTISAVDPLSNGVAVGVGQSFYRSSSASPFIPVAAPFTLTGVDGVANVEFYADDLLGQSEIVHSQSLALDSVAPETELSLSGPELTSGSRTIIAPSTLVRLTAHDPLVGGVAGGVAATRFQIDGGAATGYTAPFSLAAGPHTLSFFSVDRLDNAETPQGASLDVDGTPPQTSLVFTGPQFGGAEKTISTLTQISFNAVDPLVNGVASGVAEILLSVDGGAAAPVSAPLTLAEGVHALAFHSVDDLGNAESVQTATVRVDGAAPQSNVSVGAPQASAGSLTIVGPQTPLTLTAVDPVSNGVAAGVKSSSARQDGAAFQPVTGPFMLSGADGTHALNFFSTDNVDNIEAVQSLNLGLDATPPVSSADVAAASLRTTSAGFLASGSVLVTLSAVDPQAGGVAGGVERILYSLNGGPVLTYTGPVSLSHGRHVVQYHAEDKLNNVESAHSLTVVVDEGAPTTSLTLGTPSKTLGGDTYISPATMITLSADDDGALDFIRYRIDGGDFVTYTAPFVLSEGERLVEFQAQDAAGNLETLKNRALRVDGTAPQSTLTVGAPQVAGSPVVVGPQTPLTLSAVDPLSNGVAVGVDQALYRLSSGAPFVPALAPFFLNGLDGVKNVEFHAVDLLGREESAQSQSIALDGAAPETTLTFVGPQTTLGGVLHISTGTLISLSAQDPANGAPAGVAAVRVKVDGGAETDYNAPFALPAGPHTLVYFSVDRVNNLESAHTVSLVVDGSSPQTDLTVTGPQATVGGNLYVTPATVFGFSLEGVFGAVAHIRLSVDGGAFQNVPPTHTFSLTEGARSLSFGSVDIFGHEEPLQAVSLRVDGTAPRSDVSAGLPLADGNPQIVGPATLLTISGTDPLSNGVSAGLAALRFRLDAAQPFTVYSAPFGLAGGDGVKSLEFFGEDVLGQAEAPKTRAFRLDATPPVTTLNMSGPSVVVAGNTIFSTAALVNMNALDAAAGVLETIFSLNGAAPVAFTAPFDLPDGLHSLVFHSRDNVFNAEAEQSAVLRVDGQRPTTTLLVSGPQLMTSAGRLVSETAQLSLSPVDPGDAASGVVETRRGVDGAALSSAGALDPFTLAEGSHVVAFMSTDRLGLAEALKSEQIFVDATPPVTTLVIGQPQEPRAGQPVLVSSTTPFSFTAVDRPSSAPVAGVTRTLYRTDANAPFVVFTPPSFTLTGAPGLRTIEFYSEDALGHMETVNSLVVELKDGGAPQPNLLVADLLSPSPEAQGLARTFTPGVLPVMGSVGGPGFASYTLSFASAPQLNVPGKGPFTLIAKGQKPVTKDLLGHWKTENRSGWFTLKLVAKNNEGAVKEQTVTIYVGEPDRVLRIGHQAEVNFKLRDPISVAVDKAGRIYVGESSENLILKFDESGKHLGNLGKNAGLKDPMGLAVDADQNVFITDQDTHQLVKLNASGQVVFRVGKLNGQKKYVSGSGPGEFKAPRGVALDGKGFLYVADKGNARIQKFTVNGAFVSIINFDSRSGMPDKHDDEVGDDGEERCTPMKSKVHPHGIAVGADGLLYVTDPQHSRVVVLTPAGHLVKSVGQAGFKFWVMRRPLGIAVTPQGQIFVSDLLQVLSFDFDMNLVMNFGKRWNAPESAVLKPTGLALGPTGKLHVVDEALNYLLAFDTAVTKKTPAGWRGFGFFGPGSEGFGALGTEADPTFRLGETYSFPNPAQPGQSPTLHVEMGVANRVSLRIYDISGELVHTAELSEMPGVLRDAEGARYAYEYKWDVSGVAPGVYICMAEGEKDGERLKKIFKLAVLK